MDKMMKAAMKHIEIMAKAQQKGASCGEIIEYYRSLCLELKLNKQIKKLSKKWFFEFLSSL